MTFITVHLEVSYLLRFTLASNLVAHISQFGDGGLILYWSRIRKNVTQREHTHREQTENREQTDRESNYRGHSNPVDHRVERANIVHHIHTYYDKSCIRMIHFKISLS